MSSPISRFITGPWLLPVLISLFFTAACDSGSDVQKIDLEEGGDDIQLPLPVSHGTALLFSFDLRNSPQEDARQYLPFLTYLSQATGYPIKLYFKPQGERLADLLGQSVVDIAAVGPVSYIRAHEKYGARILVRGLNRKNRADYRSCIVVTPYSPLKKLDDLRGKTFAFGAMSSTQGHLIPRIMLQKKNISLADLQGHQYTGSHQRCAEAVISGRFAACGMQDNLARRLGKEGLVRLLACSEPYPSSGIAVAPDMPNKVADKIRKALLEFEPAGKHAKDLYRWDYTEMPNGFSRAEDTDYREIRESMIRFGMLGITPQADQP